MKKRIAIIGAGIGGLTLASRLHSKAEVTIFEKSRGLGGRMSTRQAEGFSFDHGTQFFTARVPEFKQFLSTHLSSGLVQEWAGKVITLEKGKKEEKRIWFEPHYVCVPGMNFLCKKLAEGISIRLNCEIAPLRAKAGKEWQLFDKENNSQGAFDLVISTAPPAQTVRLFDSFLSVDAGMRQEKLLACFALMIGLPQSWRHSWIAAKVKQSPIEWIAVNSTKPGRNQEHTALVVQTENSWAEAHVEEDLTVATKFLREEMESLVGLNLGGASYISLHRWRYALLEKAHDDESCEMPFFDRELQLASVGDWCARSRIEDVWLEANYLADLIL